MSEPHSELTIERWNYLFEAELAHQRQGHPARPESFVGLILAASRAHAVTRDQANTVHVLQKLVRTAVWAYRIASEGCDRPAHEFDYSQYQQFDLHQQGSDAAQTPPPL